MGAHDALHCCFSIFFSCKGRMMHTTLMSMHLCFAGVCFCFFFSVFFKYFVLSLFFGLGEGGGVRAHDALHEL